MGGKTPKLPIAGRLRVIRVEYLASLTLPGIFTVLSPVACYFSTPQPSRLCWTPLPACSISVKNSIHRLLLAKCGPFTIKVIIVKVVPSANKYKWLLAATLLKGVEFMEFLGVFVKQRACRISRAQLLKKKWNV